ncbi:MAG: carboxypeptidase M32 [Trueperaceae bacterium]|nr:MAG: carboxypeptidase M32 [Trueperaceae bacterium]
MVRSVNDSRCRRSADDPPRSVEDEVPVTTRSYERVERTVATINDVLNVINVLTWDARVHMPAAGAGARAEQLATLTTIAKGHLTNPALAADVARAQTELGADATLVQRRTLAAVREAVSHHERIPDDLTERLARAKGTAQQAWVEARRDDDFGTFAPHLARMLDLKREVASYTAPDRPVYDALLHEYEPGMTASALRTLFERLKATLGPLVAAIAETGAPRAEVLRQQFDVSRQRAFALGIAERFGYDLRRGRLDEAPHPFEISFSTNDVRITTRYDPAFLGQSVFATWHEAGHGIYEQYADPAYARSALSSDLIGLYAVSGTSYGTHESQSRLWENLVGRSRAFWDVHYGELVYAFPGQLQDVDVETFYRAINTVTPSPIRVEADEVTYHLHVILRFELEVALLDGSLGVDDLPGAWDEAMQATLGLRPRNDREGVLQDIHWSAGLVGAFPTYTIGTVMASQFFAAALRNAPGIQSDLARGEYSSLLGWLREHVYRHARLHGADELLRNATGSDLDPSAFLEYVTNKYGALYDV